MNHGGRTLRQALFGWYSEAPRESRRALIAASLGWMLDAFDVMIYSLILSSLLAHFSMSKELGGLLGSLTLVAAALGGVFFGFFADRFGRTRALMASILVYSVFTAACGFSQSILQLAVFRFLLGLGMGGEWTSGAALVAETWPNEHRGKAMGFMQSFWAVGYAAAALVNFIVMHLLALPQNVGWRVMFFVGILPALLTFWIRRRVREPQIWTTLKTQEKTAVVDRGRLFREKRLLKVTLLITLMNALTLFAYWGFNFWIPPYLSSPAGRGGLGLGSGTILALLISMQLGMWLGYLTFGYISDRLGRKRSYLAYLTAAAALVILYSLFRQPLLLFLVGPLTAFFSTGYFSGFGAITAELFPTAMRATLQGITYNTGRILSAAAPFLVGSLAQRRGFNGAFLMVSAAFALAAVVWIPIPETRGRTLE